MVRAVAVIGWRGYQPYQPGMYSRFGARVDAVTAGLYADPRGAGGRVPDGGGTGAGRARVAGAGRDQAAPEFFGREALAWAATHPTDARLAEALHRVVRATRLGCTTDGSGDVSREAFTLLHKRFPRSEWAAQTPYSYR